MKLALRWLKMMTLAGVLPACGAPSNGGASEVEAADVTMASTSSALALGTNLTSLEYASSSILIDPGVEYGTRLRQVTTPSGTLRVPAGTWANSYSYDRHNRRLERNQNGRYLISVDQICRLANQTRRAPQLVLNPYDQNWTSHVAFIRDVNACLTSGLRVDSVEIGNEVYFGAADPAQSFTAVTYMDRVFQFREQLQELGLRLGIVLAPRNNIKSEHRGFMNHEDSGYRAWNQHVADRVVAANGAAQSDFFFVTHEYVGLSHAASDPLVRDRFAWAYRDVWGYAHRAYPRHFDDLRGLFTAPFEPEFRITEANLWMQDGRTADGKPTTGPSVLFAHTMLHAHAVVQVFHALSTLAGVSRVDAFTFHTERSVKPPYSLVRDAIQCGAPNNTELQEAHCGPEQTVQPYLDGMQRHYDVAPEALALQFVRDASAQAALVTSELVLVDGSVTPRAYDSTVRIWPPDDDRRFVVAARHALDGELRAVISNFSGAMGVTELGIAGNRYPLHGLTCDIKRLSGSLSAGVWSEATTERPVYGNLRVSVQRALTVPENSLTYLACRSGS